jgi:hypothetical protein
MRDRQKIPKSATPNNTGEDETIILRMLDASKTSGDLAVVIDGAPNSG